MKAIQRALRRGYRSGASTPLIRLAALTAIAIQLTGCGPGVRVNGNSAPRSTGGTSTAAQPILLAGAPPSSVMVGTEYSFQPTVLQGSGVITFTIEGQPPWTNFNRATGALSGTPTANDVGLTPDIITITASNGTSSASIGPFTIEVNSGPSIGSATLNWSAPTENTDGMSVTDLAGYRVHFGTSVSALTQLIEVSGAATTTYVVTGLSSGTYYFAVSAYNALGNEGAFSISPPRRSELAAEALWQSLGSSANARSRSPRPTQRSARWRSYRR